MVAGLSATADGKRLAFMKLQTLASVYVGDLEGDGLRVVNLQRLTLSDSFEHAWTPDSESVLFDSNRDGSWDVFTQVLGQRTAERLVASPGGSMRPAMSPDSTHLSRSCVLLSPVDRRSCWEHPKPRVYPRRAHGVRVCGKRFGSKATGLVRARPCKRQRPQPLGTGSALAFGEYSHWDVSPDGSSLAFIKSDPQERTFRIEVRPLVSSSS